MLQLRQRQHGRPVHAPHRLALIAVGRNLFRQTRISKESMMNRLKELGLALVAMIGLAGLAIAADTSEKSVTGTPKTPTATARWARRARATKQCAIKCASAGIPVTLIEKGTDKSYILLPNKDASPIPAKRDLTNGRRGNGDRQGIQQKRHGIPGRRVSEVASGQYSVVSARILPGASQLQNYHPLLVHFPIAFIYGASLMYFLAWITASEKLQWDCPLDAATKCPRRRRSTDKRLLRRPWPDDFRISPQ